MAAQPLVNASNVHTIREMLTWVAPPIAIPVLRYTQDNHQQRKELFVRDASTYSIGAAIFLLSRWGLQKAFDHFNLIQNPAHRNLTAFLIALTANLLYAGIGAVRFSHAFSKYQARSAVTKNTNVTQPVAQQSLYSTAPVSSYQGVSQLQPNNLQPWQRMQYLA